MNILLNADILLKDNFSSRQMLSSVDVFLHEGHHALEFSLLGKTSERGLSRANLVNERSNSLMEVSEMKNYNFNINMCKEITTDYSGFDINLYKSTLGKK